MKKGSLTKEKDKGIVTCDGGDDDDDDDDDGGG